jgi:hypothetical protein
MLLRIETTTAAGKPNTACFRQYSSIQFTPGTSQNTYKEAAAVG